MRHSDIITFFIGVLAPLFLTAQFHTPAVRFEHGNEYFPSNFQEFLKAPIPESDYVHNRFVRFVQVSELPDQASREGLEQLGIIFIHYIDFGAYLISIPRHFDLQQLEILRPVSLIRPVADWKIHHNLKEKPIGAWAIDPDGIKTIVQLYPHIAIGEGAKLLSGMGYKVIAEGVMNGYLEVLIPETDFVAVADLPFVQWIERIAPPAQKEDLAGRSLHRSNLLDSEHPLGKKYDGTGVATLVRDDGAVGAHIDFQGRLFNQIGADAPEAGNHGDGVGGIMGGAGNLDPTQKGMAPGSDIYVMNYSSGFQDATMSLVQNKNVTITNSSYSDGCNDGYTLSAQTVDQQIYMNPRLMHVFSAGNSNGSNCGYGAGLEWGNITGGHKMGKNIITTANLDANGQLALSSSRGPATDGRIKPDIAANGAGQTSTDMNNAYQPFGGTSAAAPGIAGCLAQLTHAYKTIHNTTQAPAALLKLALLNTALDLGNIGPDFKYGWGQVNAWKALQLIEQNRYTAGVAAQNSVTNTTFQVPAGTAEVKIMLYWADPPAATAAARALVNDLDITVTGPGGTLFKPWTLNPAANAFTLNLPATNGRDSLNNVEQVAITNPTEGTYTIKVKGHQVPMGPQNFYISWELQDQRVQLTYPSGGEGFVPGTVEKIRWDAFDNTEAFTLKYSINGGNSFFNIITVGPTVRSYDWHIPNIINGNVKVAVFRGNSSDTSNQALSIAPVPADLQVIRVCPDSIALSWSKVPGNNIRYDIFQLGAKRMELRATSVAGASSMKIPVVDPLQEAWFSIRCSQPEGLAGQRSTAIYWPGGLKSCSQGYDLEVVDMVSPKETSVYTCGALSKMVKVIIQNNGEMSVDGAMISYQYGTEPPVVNPVPFLLPGQVIEFTFDKPLIFNENGFFDLEISITNVAGEILLTNNTFLRSFDVVADVVNTPFDEGFEMAELLPANWRIQNPDLYYSWDKFVTPVRGFEGDLSQVLWLNHYAYASKGQNDHLVVPPISLSGFDLPFLEFDHSHATFSEEYQEILRLELFTGCDLLSPPVVLWEQADPALADTFSASSYYPTEAGLWRRESISLLPFLGQKFLLRFTAVNGFGNNLFLDNVRLKNYQQPSAEFAVNPFACTGAVVVFHAAQKPENNDMLEWHFGAGATPASATGPGPHQVVFGQTGVVNSYLVVHNDFGTDTAFHQVSIGAAPVANFQVSGTGVVYTFTNTTLNAETYGWDFGDGTTSTLQNPTHQYLTDGIYKVTLTATNSCGTHVAVHYVQVVTPPDAAFVSTNRQGCGPLTIAFTNAASANTVSYYWQFQGGTPAESTLPNPTVVYSVPGNYTATLQVMNSAGTDVFSVSDIMVSGPPSVVFTPVTNNFSVQFNNQTQGAVNCLWDFGDGTYSTSMSPQHTYVQDGLYAVMLTCSNNCGTAYGLKNIQISTKPVAQFKVGSGIGCAPFVVQYTNTSSLNATGFVWQFPGGTPAISTEKNPVVVYTSPGTYSATLMASNAMGMSVATQSNIIEVGAAPVLLFDVTVQGRTIYLDNNSLYATGYHWDFGDGSFSDSDQPEHTYSMDGTYIVSLFGENTCGQFAKQQTLQIATLPEAGYSASSNVGCVPFAVTFTNASSANATSFYWSFPGGNPAFSTAENPVVVYTQPGVYPVLLTASNTVGSAQTDSAATITAHTVPAAAFSYAVNGNAVQFENLSSSANVYFWSFGDGTYSTDAQPMHEYTNDGVFAVTLYATNGCGTVETSQSLVISTPLYAGFAAQDTTGCAPMVVNFSNLSSANAQAFLWEFPGGTPSFSTEMNPSILYEVSGAYPVKLTAMNNTGNAHISQAQFVQVLTEPQPFFTYYADELTAYFTNLTQYSGNYLWDFGDGITSVDSSPEHQYVLAGHYPVRLTVENECGMGFFQSEAVVGTVGVSETNAEQAAFMEVFPNPSDGRFVLVLHKLAAAEMTLELYNMLGQKLKQEQIEAGEKVRKTDYSGFPAGTYVLRIGDGINSVAMRLEIVQE